MSLDPHAYAAAVRARRVLECKCLTCIQNEMLPSVQQILAAQAEREAALRRQADFDLTNLFSRWMRAA